MLTIVPPPTQTHPARPASLPPIPQQIAPSRRAIFGALLWKEVHENGALIPFCWMFAGLLMILVIASSTSGFTRPFVHRNLLMDKVILTFVPAACALLGVLQGLALHRTERSFDAWSLLVHRPLSRTALFAYRSAIGLLLYTLAVGLPLALFLSWATLNPFATERFVGAFYLPYIADVLLGVATFFVGTLVSQRRARALATALLAGVVGMGLFVLDIALPNFWWVIAAHTTGILLLATVSWSSTRTHGEHRHEPLPARVALVTTLFLGATGIGLVVSFLLAAWLNSCIHEASSRVPYRWADVVMLDDGQIAVRLTEQGESQVVRNYLTPEGAPIADPHEIGYAISSGIGPEVEHPRIRHYRDVDSILDSEGAPRPPATPQDYGVTMPPLQSGEQLLAVRGFSTPTQHLVVLTSRALYFFRNPAQAAPLVFPLPQSHAVIGFRASIDYSYYGIFTAHPPSPSTTVDVYDGKGKLLSSKTVDLTKQPFAAYARPENQLSLVPRESWLADFAGTLGLPAPAIFLLKWTISEQSQYQLGNHFWSTVLPIYLLAALVIFFLSRRYALRTINAAAWTLATLFLGPWTVIIFLGTQHRPALRPCPACHRPRSVETDTCPHCRAPWPLPEPAPTQILASQMHPSH